jgi:hypothetical protein
MAQLSRVKQESDPDTEITRAALMGEIESVREMIDEAVSKAALLEDELERLGDFVELTGDGEGVVSCHGLLMILKAVHKKTHIFGS